MSILQALDDYKINPFEYAHLIEDTPVTSTSFKLHVPKLMPLIPKKPPAKINGVFNNNIFINDADCKPTTSQQVVTQNYITVDKYTERGFQHAAHDGTILTDTRMIIHVMDENIRDMRINDVL